ncbi:hypothetical protein H6P81_011403 [Aristolochia fimbriata]|uniref:Cytochrome c domain-containing protein n=1 Tax=Aristolochia fimbriata TaxID=158543 RepID=A0AAV7ERV3_ARIFI|nr:hypothetical protein H6P81_011403 [Aristolochia fimbriata]
MDSRLTTRCSPVFFLETIQKAKLKEKHIRAIKKDPIWALLGSQRWAYRPEWAEGVWYYETMSRLGKFTFCTNKLVDPTTVPCVLKWGSNKVHRSGDMKKFTKETRDLQLKLKNATLESKIGKMEVTLEDVQLKMVVMQARLDGAPEEAPAAEEAPADSTRGGPNSSRGGPSCRGCHSSRGHPSSRGRPSTKGGPSCSGVCGRSRGPSSRATVSPSPQEEGVIGMYSDYMVLLPFVKAKKQSSDFQMNIRISKCLLVFYETIRYFQVFHSIFKLTKKYGLVFYTTALKRCLKMAQSRHFSGVVAPFLLRGRAISR